MKGIKVLIDLPESSPSKDFELLAETISTLIQNSEPHFVTGIYGEWGTGKTTLMKQIQKNISDYDDDHNTLTIWFNAWKYEREEQFATVALLKNIAYAMTNNLKFEPIRETIFNALKIFGKESGKQLLQEFLSQEVIKEIKENISKKFDLLMSIEKETIYYDGLSIIETQMRKIRKNNKNCKIIVFIDDLDRCSPKKALEVLESIKVFLDMEGFVYVIGLSHTTLAKLISYSYNDVGVDGSDYLQKIIQIPLNLPKWDDTKLIDLIENNIAKSIDRKYYKLISDNSNILIKTVQNNPRQLKRFINNLIIAFESFSDTNNKKLSLVNLFVVQVLHKRYPKLVKIIEINNDCRDFFKKILKGYSRLMILRNTDKSWRIRERYKSDNELVPLFNELYNNPQPKLSHIRMLLRKLIPNELKKKELSFDLISSMSEISLDDWRLLRRYIPDLMEITDWSIYRKANEIVEDKIFENFPK
ncbi:KAP family P-loop NTPase fold protein [Candidatus Nitrosotenuis cloacae]|uniref:KAP NTPase domain-containing protein n=1 Tax=Candidatus Nitrosotenuis cloacae TaxID=1603555 RepID=A0A3G1B627_9ARCH|nr:P-loop NTPase fold protein [Candidatus Nitrosotenuis cloacae]AJZ75555.1 hypothetical protein SU86_003270 [Candidatus Nitrosotenuis cloacae]